MIARAISRRLAGMAISPHLATLAFNSLTMRLLLVSALFTCLIGMVTAKTKVHVIGMLVCHADWDPDLATVTLINDGSWGRRVFQTVRLNKCYHHWFLVIRSFFDRKYDLKLLVRHNCGVGSGFAQMLIPIQDGHHNLGAIDITPYTGENGEYAENEYGPSQDIKLEPLPNY